MHHRGFTHRDIKPENILLDSNLEVEINISPKSEFALGHINLSIAGQPVLIDFGLSTKTTPGQQIRTVKIGYADIGNVYLHCSIRDAEPMGSWHRRSQPGEPFCHNPQTCGVSVRCKCLEVL